MSLIKSEDRLHLEVAVAALRIAEAVADNFPKVKSAPDWLREPLQTYREARHKVSNDDSAKAAIRGASERPTLKTDRAAAPDRQIRTSLLPG